MEKFRGARQPVPVCAWHRGEQLLSTEKGISLLLIYELLIIIIAFAIYGAPAMHQRLGRPEGSLPGGELGDGGDDIGNSASRSLTVSLAASPRCMM